MRRGTQKITQQMGAAILAAMVTVSVVAAVAAAAIHQQWQLIQVEAMERAQGQARWLLRGAMDWARLLLRQDAQSAGGVDHLSEPWAIGLQPTQLSAFVSGTAAGAPGDASADIDRAQLAGHIEDLQSRLNLLNMALDAFPAHARHVRRLFERLGLPASEFDVLQQGLRNAQNAALGDARPLMPQALQDLAWLGLAPATIAALTPYATLVPAVTRVNLNTAQAPVLWAVGEDLDWGQVGALVAERQRQHFRSVADARERTALALDEFHFSTSSSHFLAEGQVGMAGVQLRMQATLQRTGTQVKAVQVSTTGVAIAP